MEKEKSIYEAKAKISDLQKAKHVLSFRTTEMRKSLEPKEAQIESLKEDIFKIEGEYEEMIKSKNQITKALKLKKQESENLGGANQRLSETIKLKNKEIKQLKLNMYKFLQEKDPKETRRQLNNFYQESIKKDESSIFSF